MNKEKKNCGKIQLGKLLICAVESGEEKKLCAVLTRKFPPKDR